MAHNLALGTLQRGLKKRRMEVDGQSESKRLVEVKMAGIQRNGSGPGTCDYLGSVLPGLADFPISRIAELTPTAWANRN
jgi:hypothetical protein